MKKESIEGTRGRIGRPRLEAGEQKRRNVSLSDRLVEKAREIGDGNVSEGIRKALESFR